MRVIRTINLGMCSTSEMNSGVTTIRVPRNTIVNLGIEVSMVYMLE